MSKIIAISINIFLKSFNNIFIKPTIVSPPETITPKLYRGNCQIPTSLWRMRTAALHLHFLMHLVLQ